MFVPSGFKKIAEYPTRISVTECYHHPERNLLYFTIKTYDDRELALGPMKREDMESMVNCMVSVFEMKGRYMYME